ncbi:MULTISPECIES: hypothetical protein [Edaphosphingomonas]|uniref:PspC domain-containing protein n=2 Tax=Edaphosphingomonas TaxID=3423724 RepID=A0A2T4HWR9_9SPHN|nr:MULTISPECIES: hypothetical protein [Sphingomonas]OHT19223.1 hypothetical protein BHE75_01206 [Sphingomonas haloaromaticamans]PTD20266.1 hypothetical protein CV103_11840 [Sphingomonas fennica]
MQADQPSLFRRPDTMLGICEALGEDLGFNPIVLRIALGSLVLWNPKIAIGAYLALGVLVLLSRLIFPARRVAADAGVDKAMAVETAAPAAINDAPAVEMAEAA